jgi:beta-phosphoglucomutase-like phosphatase (HAD superfamily)/dTDP-glucose pyrophosphorylase
MRHPIKLVVFDLDGVLIDSRYLHFLALNAALQKEGPQYELSLDEHLSKYDGLPTRVKLQMLSDAKGLPSEAHDRVWREKQETTLRVIRETVRPDAAKTALLEDLKNAGLGGPILACASNSTRSTMRAVLERMDLLRFFQHVVSNEDVDRAKPCCQIYTHIMSAAAASPFETLVVEDSPIGRMAAFMSGAHVMEVGDSSEVTSESVRAAIARASQKNESLHWDLRWKNRIQVVVPMAGLGTRFASDPKYAGTPKPLLPVHGFPMIELVVRNLNIDGTFVFVLLREHAEQHPAIVQALRDATRGGCEIVYVEKTTEGPASTVLLCEKVLDRDIPLLVANCDQYVEWNSNEFLYKAKSMDGCIQTFYKDPREKDAKWSYVRLDDDQAWVTELREKQVISDKATTGIYYWKRAGDFVDLAKEMIAADERVNGEFYVGPVYNYAIRKGMRIGQQPCAKMWGLGVPLDLETFVREKRAQDVRDEIYML